MAELISLADRAQRVRNLKFEFEKNMCRMSEIIVELNDLGCQAAVRYEQTKKDQGYISLLCVEDTTLVPVSDAVN
jgi:hypothetical protein